ncbi:hypothetical protein CDAR_294591 [Caerostris darwini]|uniref:Uncharacterized protein n=1 Tax=Caerostris darwini TaxID=1538125 RepID=A0AAV4UL17_9ARAC|nr:hypothetical protein CDAR_294591 [Caerostris darwini]
MQRKTPLPLTCLRMCGGGFHDCGFPQLRSPASHRGARSLDAFARRSVAVLRETSAAIGIVRSEFPKTTEDAFLRPNLHPPAPEQIRRSVGIERITELFTNGALRLGATLRSTGRYISLPHFIRDFCELHQKRLRYIYCIFYLLFFCLTQSGFPFRLRADFLCCSSFQDPPPHLRDFLLEAPAPSPYCEHEKRVFVEGADVCFTERGELHSNRKKIPPDECDLRPPRRLRSERTLLFVGGEGLHFINRPPPLLNLPESNLSLPRESFFAPILFLRQHKERCQKRTVGNKITRKSIFCCMKYFIYL